MRRKKLFLMMIALLSLLGLSACGSNKKIVLTTGFAEDEIFRIDDVSCTKQEALVYLTNISNQYSAMFGDEIWDYVDDGVTFQEDVKQTVLARLAKIKVMNLMASNYNISLDGDTKKNIEEAAKTYFETLTPLEIETMGNVDKDMICQMYKEYAIAELVYENITKDENPEISDEEARTVVVKQIYIPTVELDASGNKVPLSESKVYEAHDKIVEAYNRCQEGEDFDVVSNSYSLANDETVSYRKGELEPALEDGVFNLSEGEISQILPSTDGYYIFYCVNPFDRNETESTKLEIINERKKEAFASVYDFYVSERKCYLNEELWATIECPKDDEIDTYDFFNIYKMSK